MKAGDIYYDKFGPVRIMAVVEGYVLARRPRCTPFVVFAKKWPERFQKNLVDESPPIQDSE